MYHESRRKEEPQDAIPILSFAEELAINKDRHC